jgi:hypothetical protein
MPNILQPSLSNTPTYKQTTETTGIAPYATDLLQRGQAFTTAETPVYEGQLTTGPSKLQEQAFTGIANLTVPKNITEAGNQLGNISTQQQNLSYDPTKFTAGTFGTEEAQKYMNPYIQTALDPQLAYMRRQAQINQQADMAKLSQAGAFGGSRQAILQGQNQEALMRKQAETTGAGYEKAYKSAMDQYNEDMRRDMEAQKAAENSKQFGATYKQTGLSNAASSEQARAAAGGHEASYGLQNLKALSEAGATQRDIDQDALDAQYKDWLRQTEYPGKQLETMKGLTTAMAGVLPKTEVGYGQKEKAASTVAGAISMGKKMLSDLGIKSFDDLKTKASAAGLSIKDFATKIGVKESDLPQEVGKEGQEVAPGEKAETGLEEPTDTSPVQGEDTGGYDTTGYGPSVIDPGEYDTGYLPEGSFGEGEYAQGGLIDLLHKMRGSK